MESTVFYIIVAIIMALTVTVYNYKKKQIRRYLLSMQQYPEADVSVNIQKTQGKISDIIIKVFANKDIHINDIKVELISKKREFNYYSLISLVENSKFPVVLKKGADIEFEVPFNDFKAKLMDGEHPFSTYRFMVIANKNQSYKSHEMGFNKRWVIYRPDTGSYN